MQDDGYGEHDDGFYFCLSTESYTFEKAMNTESYHHNILGNATCACGRMHLFFFFGIN